MAQGYLLGSDIGSGSCKTLLARADGTVIARGTGQYDLQHPRAGWSEYDPQDWYKAFCASVRMVLTESGIEPKQIQAVCIVGITHDAVLLDSNGEVLRNSIHFNDQRSLEQCERLKAQWGDAILEQATNVMGPLWTFPQLIWIKENEPDIWAKTKTILFPKDYVRRRLTGNSKAYTDYIEATGTLFFDPTQEAWIEEFVEEFDSPELLPYIRSPFEVIGAVSALGAEDSGLAKGTTVIVGTTDTAAENLAVGAVSSAYGTVKLASVGRIAFISEWPAQHQHILNYPYFETLWYPGTAMKYAASAYRWLREALWDGRPENDYEMMDQAAENTPAGADGLIFLPHLLGQFAPYWDPNLTGGFLGVGIQHDLRHFTRAVLEGVAMGLREALEVMQELGFDAENLMLIGNGAKSPLWGQIMANVLNRKLVVPKERDAAYGAVLIAGTSVGVLPQVISALAQYVVIERELIPDHQVKIYEELYPIYQAANDMMPKISADLYQFRQNREHGLD